MKELNKNIYIFFVKSYLISFACEEAITFDGEEVNSYLIAIKKNLFSKKRPD